VAVVVVVVVELVVVSDVVWRVLDGKFTAVENVGFTT